MHKILLIIILLAFAFSTFSKHQCQERINVPPNTCGKMCKIKIKEQVHFSMYSNANNWLIFTLGNGRRSSYIIRSNGLSRITLVDGATTKYFQVCADDKPAWGNITIF